MTVDVSTAPVEVPEAVPTDRASSAWHNLKGRLSGQVQAVGVTAVLLALFLITGLHNHLFWGPNNLKVLATNMSFVALTGVGMTILMITGNIDLSVGSAVGLTAVLTAMLARTMPLPLAFICGVLIGGVIGAVNGTVVWNVSTSPIIITLGGLTLLQGINEVITNGEAVSGMPANFTSFGNASPLGIPISVWIFVGAAILGFIFLTFTKTGRHVYAIGGNKEASRAAGINVRRIVIGSFIATGLLVGLTGVLQASYYGNPDDTFGVGFELQVITGVIVGGVSFAGGEGGVVRAMLGIALLQVVAGSVVSLNINPNYADVITGAILILAVSSDHIVHARRQRHQKAAAMKEYARLLEERRRSQQASGQATVRDATAVAGRG
jgi:ribose/xylose/arabinose/galactoside ABC-type transport system permease subunit